MAACSGTWSGYVLLMAFMLMATCGLVSGTELAPTCYGLIGAGLIPADGFYKIDPDGAGGVDEFQVYCEFEELDPLTSGPNARTYVYLDNDLRYKCFYRPSPGLISPIAYRDSVSAAQMRALIDADASQTCDQYIKYECLGGSALKLSATNHDRYGYWVGGDGAQRYYWGGGRAQDRSCSCHHSELVACVTADHKCNCPGDNDTAWFADQGLLMFGQHLPVTKVMIGDIDLNAGKKANVMLGALRCYQGDKIKIADTADHDCYTGPYFTTSTPTPTTTPSGAEATTVGILNLDEKTVAAVCVPLALFLLAYAAYAVYVRNESRHEKFAGPSRHGGYPDDEMAAEPVTY